MRPHEQYFGTDAVGKSDNATHGQDTTFGEDLHLFFFLFYPEDTPTLIGGHVEVCTKLE